MVSARLINKFAASVTDARSHQGRKAYKPMVHAFVKLTERLEKSDPLPESGAEDLNGIFLREMDKKMMRAAEGFADLLSFAGKTERMPLRAHKIFERSVAGFIGTRDVELKTLYFQHRAPSRVLQHLWIGLPHFTPRNGAENAMPEGAPRLLVSVGYEQMFAQDGFRQLLAMAQNAGKKGVDINFTCPNARTFYSGARQDFRPGKGIRHIDLQQELGEAHVFPVFSKIVISLNLDKPFDAGKYPATYAALAAHRQGCRGPVPVPAKPAADQTLTRQEMIDAHVRANPSCRIPKAFA